MTKKADWAHIQRIIAKAAADTGGGSGNGMIPSGLGTGKGLLGGMGKSAPQAPSKPAVAPQKPAVEPIPANVPPPPYVPPPASGLPPAQPMAVKRAEGGTDVGFNTGMKTTGLTPSGAEGGFGLKTTPLTPSGGLTPSGAGSLSQPGLTPAPTTQAAQPQATVNPYEGGTWQSLPDGSHTFRPPGKTTTTHGPNGSYTERWTADTSALDPELAQAAAKPPVSPEQVNPESGQISGQAKAPAPPQTQVPAPVTPQNEPVKQPVTPSVESSVQTTELPAADAPGSEIFDDPPPTSAVKPQPAVTPDQPPGTAPPGQNTAATANPADSDLNAAEAAATDPAKSPAERAEAVKPGLQAWMARPENAQHRKGLEDLTSGDPERAKSPEALALQETMNNTPDKLMQEEFQKRLAQNPNPDPKTYGQMASEVRTHVMDTWNNMDTTSKLLVGIGLPVGLIGILSSLFGEGGATGGILGALGLGAAGLAATNSGMFGNDARAGLGGIVADAANFFDMAPDASALTPEGMAKGQAEGEAAVQAAMDKAKAEGGNAWDAGQQAFNQAKAPLDRLHSIGPEAGTTMLMGILKTNDPAVARAKYDELMTKREQFSAPDYLFNQATEKAKGYVPSFLPESWRNTAGAGLAAYNYGKYTPQAQ